MIWYNFVFYIVQVVINASFSFFYTNAFSIIEW